MAPPACVRCGQPITPGARFCTRCGADVSGEQGNVATARMPSVPMEESGMDLLRRATIGEYEILTELGRGGMATVYLAHEISLDRKVAIKVMAPQLMFGEGMAERFRREARTAASLSHPHIIPIYAVKESGRVLYFVMKFIAGRPLDDIIRQVGPLPIPMVQAILSQVGSALGYAHRRGIIHRDIKPANIMIDDEGWAVVTDFGIAKVAETQGLTMTGVAVGTPSYMSPEQCAAREVTGRSDQYSLGVVAYEMVTGKQPFVADTAMAIMWQHFNDAPRPLRELRPDCPPELEAAILRMMGKQPDQRWSSIEEAIAAIGATPLAHDDPVRLQMVALAQSSMNQRLLEEMKTPTSLVPPTRASGKQATEVIAGVGSVGVSPRSANLAAGESLQLTALVQDTRGETVVGRAVAWASANPALATVTPAGLVTALAPGEVAITATCEGQSGACQLIITPVPVAAIVVAPATGTLEAGQTLQLHATLKDPQGKPITDRQVSWTSSDTDRATVSGTGMVTGVKPGPVTISARAEDRVGTATVTVQPARVAALETVPATLSLRPGSTAVVRVTVRDRNGNELKGRSVTWASRTPTIATVAPTGEVSAVAPGAAQVVATCEGQSATVSVTVQEATAARIEISGQGGNLEPGETVRLQARVLDDQGAVLARRVTWSTSAPEVVSVSPDGAVTALKVGRADVLARADEAKGRVPITVVPIPVGSVTVAPPAKSLAVGETMQLTAVVRDSRGRDLSDRRIEWRSAKPAVATVDQAGLVRGVKPGTAALTATVEGRKATVECTVTAPAPASEVATEKLPAQPVREPALAPAPGRETPAPAVPAGKKSRMPLVIATVVVLAALGLWKFGPWNRTAEAAGGATSLVVTPASQTLAVGDSLLMAAELRDATGQPVEAGGSVAWSSDNPSVAVVSGNVVRAMAGGTATIVGEAAGGLRAMATITVTGAAVPDREGVASLALAQSPASLAEGETVQLTALARDQDGNPLNGRPIAWFSSAPAVAEVTPTGLVSARSAGTVVITASSEGKSVTLNLRVTPAAVAAVTVTPSRSSLEPGQQLTLIAEPRDARGSALSGREIRWSSSNPRIATVTESGQVAAVANGSATITAQVGDRRGTATISVVTNRVDVATIALSPGSGQLDPGERLQLDAQLKDARGGAIRDRTPAWSSSDPSVATVSSSGQVTAVGPGTATITAESDSRRAQARIEVRRPAVAAIAVSQPPAALPVGESFQLAATVKDARGNPLDDRTVKWSSSNQRVATVSSTGVVTAVGQGNARITATADGKNATVSLTVPAPPAAVARIEVAPPPALTVGETAQLGATVADARGTPLDRGVTWSSSNPAVATVSRTGLVTAAGAGNATITATSEGKTATVSITVAAREGGPGPGDNAGRPTPSGGLAPRGSIVAGGNFSCGLVSGGGLACWGAGKSVPEPLGDQRFTRISAGENHACGLAGGAAWCWGQNNRGQVGDGTSNNTRAAPVAVTGGLSFRTISAGGSHSCGVATNGKAYCWGDNRNGQLGDGSTSGRTRPVQVADRSFTEVSAGGNHSCGIATDGKAFCWGDGFSGQLGYGNLSTENLPIEVDAGGVKFVHIYAGGGHSCALTPAGKAYCWGDNRNGQVGDGSTSDRRRPVEVQTSVTFEELSLGNTHTCGRTSGGQVYCWGNNGRGQLGTGSRASQNKPVRVGSSETFTDITAGGSHTCAATAADAFCWGENIRGQLGDGGTTPQLTPTPVQRLN